MGECVEALAAAGAETLRSSLGRRGGPCVATMGTFDGVHGGHRALVRWAQREARAMNLPLVALTFHPRPEVILAPERALPDICPIEERVRRMIVAGADEVIVVPFSREVAAVRAASFVAVLQEHVGVRRLCVGDDFALGRGREGTRAEIERLGLSTAAVPLLHGADGRKISSSSIRTRLQHQVSSGLREPAPAA